MVSAGKRVLIVDDDPLVRLVYMNNLKAAGLEVEAAADGETAWAKLEAGAPAAVLLDLILPHLSGVEFLQRLKAHAGFASVPVLVFTNAFLSSLTEEARKHGAAQVFDKATALPSEVVNHLCQAVAAAPVPPLVGPGSSPPPLPAQDPASQGAGSAKAASDGEATGLFFAELPRHLAAMRSDLHAFVRITDPEKRTGHLRKLRHTFHGLTGGAASTGLNLVATKCAAIEALLNELQERPENLTPSALRTLSHATDVLSRLLEKATTAEDLRLRQPLEALIVDDDPICRMAVAKALERAGFNVLHLGQATEAFRHLETTPVALIVMDVLMPEMSGFDLCRKVRAGSANRKTPVIFVTSLSDFQSRSSSILSGGDDIIAKPFLSMELAVKALTFAVKWHLAGLKSAPQPSARSPGEAEKPPGRPLKPEGQALKTIPPEPASSPEPARPSVDFQKIVASIPQGVVTTDEKGRIESINTAGASLFGYAAEELVGRSIETLVSASLSYLLNPPPEGGALPTGDNTQGGRWVVVRAADGSDLPVLLVLKRIKVGAKGRLTGVFYDHRHIFEATLKQTCQRLETELQRVRDELGGARLRLDRAVAAKEHSEQRLACLEEANKRLRQTFAERCQVAATAGAGDPELRRQVHLLTLELERSNQELANERNLRAQAEQLAEDFSNTVAEMNRRLARQNPEVATGAARPVGSEATNPCCSGGNGDSGPAGWHDAAGPEGPCPLAEVHTEATPPVCLEKNTP